MTDPNAAEVLAEALEATRSPVDLFARGSLETSHLTLMWLAARDYVLQSTSDPQPFRDFGTALTRARSEALPSEPASTRLDVLLDQLDTEISRSHDAGEHDYERGLRFLWNPLIARLAPPAPQDDPAQ